MTVRHTHRWYGIAAVAFFAAGAGVVVGRPALLLASVVGVGFAAYARAADPPAASLDLERDLDEAEPDPDDAVTVTVRVTNTGTTLLDLRLIDGVPGPIEVTDGSPRRGTALRRGKTVEFAYEITAQRGVHDFDPLTAIVRDPSGGVEREATVDAATTLTCLPRLDPPTTEIPLREQTGKYTGGVAADSGGSGLEFYATREYRHGDPMARIDWNRLARTGEPTTVLLREERMVNVVLVLDAREEAYVGGEDHALERSVHAAARLYAGLVDDGHRVGIGAIGDADCWLEPGSGDEHAERARWVLAANDALSPTPPDGSILVTRRLHQLKRRLPAGAQVILLSPLLDDYVSLVAGRLEAYGNAVTVLSPDVTDDATAGRQLSRVERRARIARLRYRSIPVIDWPRGRALDHALAAAVEARG